MAGIVYKRVFGSFGIILSVGGPFWSNTQMRMVRLEVALRLRQYSCLCHKNSVHYLYRWNSPVKGNLMVVKFSNGFYVQFRNKFK